MESLERRKRNDLEGVNLKDLLQKKDDMGSKLTEIAEYMSGHSLLDCFCS